MIIKKYKRKKNYNLIAVEIEKQKNYENSFFIIIFKLIMKNIK